MAREGRDARGEDAPFGVLEQGALRGKRIVIERYGKPVAALVSTEDLARLEERAGESAEERYGQALEEAGIQITNPDPGKRSSRSRRLARIEGKPLSEQIIEDRR
jgi:antitoxin (DNA-binding transcriptional repressor) of toxin-antitoxin stability system